MVPGAQAEKEGQRGGVTSNKARGSFGMLRSSKAGGSCGHTILAHPQTAAHGTERS